MIGPQGTHPLTRRIGTLLAATLLLLGLVLPLTTRAQPAEDEASRLEGEYAVTIARLDVPRDVPNAPSYIGRWRIAFSVDGTFSVERLDIGTVVEGTYEVDGERVTLTDATGLLACTVGFDGATDVSTATYQWTILADRLSFFPIEDGCEGRRILLSTRQWEVFVACLTQALADGATTPEATAQPTEESPLDILRPGETPAGEAAAATPAIAAAIDDLLAQMTACWATGDPAQFLPLLSSGFLRQFQASIAGPGVSEADFLAILRQAMAAPFVFERAGDIAVEDDTRVTAIVRTQIAGSEDFTRFRFVLEGGRWLWDGFA